MGLSQSTQGEQENEQPQKVSSHSLSAQHTNTLPLTVSTPHPIREQHVNETVFSTRFLANTRLQPTICIPKIQLATQSNVCTHGSTLKGANIPQVKRVHQDSSLKSLFARTKDKMGQPSSTLPRKGANIPPAKKVCHNSPKQTSTRKMCQPSSLQDSSCAGIPLASPKRVSTRTRGQPPSFTLKGANIPSVQDRSLKRFLTRTRAKKGQPQGADTSPAKRVCHNSPKRTSTRKRCQLSSALQDSSCAGIPLASPKRVSSRTRGQPPSFTLKGANILRAKRVQDRRLKHLLTRTRAKKGQPQGADIPPTKRVSHNSPKQTPTRKRCRPSSASQDASCTGTLASPKRVSSRTRGSTLQRVTPKQLAGSSRQYESDYSDSTFIQQYDSDNSQQSDGDCSETDDDTRQHHLIASSSQTKLNFNQIHETLFEVRAKWYNLGLALGLDTGTLNSIKLYNKEECEACLRDALTKQKDTTKLTWTKIIKALRNLTVGENTLADKLQRKYAPESMSQSRSQSRSGPTPECVVRYTSFLKDKYKHMLPFPDDWPPPLEKKTSSKLALIEKKQLHFPQAKYTRSIEYEYATGNVDNITERKQGITLEQIFMQLPGDSKETSQPNQKSKRYTVVMDGAPGVGKTTLSRKICIDWAQGNFLKDHHIVILKPLRELRGHIAATFSDLFNSDDFELNEKEKILKHIKSTFGSEVMFIFDGFDELSSKQRSDKNTIFWEIIRGNKLHNCSVLVTSRSYASGPLQEINRVNRYVEVLGFKRNDIEHCIKQNITDKEKSKELIQMLKDRLDIVSLCYIPLNCTIVLYVYQQQGTLPDTLTQLYEVFILYTVKHHMTTMFQQEEQIRCANNIEDFPATIIEHLDSLCELAYTGMTQEKLVFNYKEVMIRQKLDTTSLLSVGLLNLIKTFNKEQTEAHYYQFLHLTTQEFLAARHLARTKSNKEKQQFITSKVHVEKFRMTLLFLSGLTKLNFIAVEQAFPAPKSIEIGVTYEYKTTERSRFLFLAHFLYESQQTTYNWLLPCLVTNSLDLSEHSLSQFDCLVLANFLTLTPKDHVWDEINLSQCSLTIDKIELLVSKKHLQRDIPVLCLTKRLDLSTFETARISPNSFIALFGNDSKLENIYIPHLKLVEKICCQSLLGETLIRAQSLQELKMGSATSESSFDSDITCTSTCIRKSEIRIDTMQICSGVIQNFFKSVEPKKVRTIALCKPGSFENCSQCSSLGSDAWESFCNVIKNSEYIQHLQINKNHFHAQDILSLIATFQNKRNLRTLQFPGSKIDNEGLIHLRNNLPLNVRAEISTSYFSNLTMSLRNDNLVYFDIEPRVDTYIYKDNNHADSLCAILTILPLFWSTYHALSPTKQRIPHTLTNGTITADSPFSKANLLNTHFTSCLSNTTDVLSSPWDAPVSPSLDSISCSPDQVLSLLSRTKLKTASGPDGISSHMLRKTSSSIHHFFTYLFNKSIETGVFPEEWKASNVTPIFKAGDPKLASNYRPISLLSLLSKVLERIVLNKVVEYLTSNNLLSTLQFGFRRGSSTQEAILHATHDWHRSLDNGSSVAAVFFDLSKAFDRVPHQGLLKTLWSAGISGSLHKWFTSYLTNRKQKVVLDGHSSSTANVNSGVPQGSILGPLLFSLYIDPLTRIPLSPGSQLLLYADDILLYSPIRNEFDVLDLQGDIDAIANWVNTAGLTLNQSKTKLLLLSRKRQPPSIILSTNSGQITQVNSLSYLGVTITKDLKWNSHISNTCAKAKSKLGLLYRHFNQADQSTLSSLYKSLVLPLLDYCSSVWDPSSSCAINQLESVKKFGARLCTKRWSDQYLPLLASLSWPSLSTRRSQQKVTLCCRIIRGESILHSSRFTPNPKPNPRHYHHDQPLLIPFAKTLSYQSSFRKCGSTLEFPTKQCCLCK
ncbi:uncharacterized protein LOC135337956 [Halichondria panicea]|uniref:uncharacterized protein LOC135337956 n=1 Tax=Halichondria panicea TaxID=6063 RepID=UPI00312B8FDD